MALGLAKAPSEFSEDRKHTNNSLPRGWPTEPRELKRNTTQLFLDVAADIVLGGLSILFFVFGLLVQHYDQTPVVDHRRVASSLVTASTLVRIMSDLNKRAG